MPGDNCNIHKGTNERNAFVAAPKHHTLLIKNDFASLINTLIPPGEVTNIPAHKWTASPYVIRWSNFIRYDATENVIVDNRKTPQTPLPSSAHWSAPLTPHAKEHTGKNKIHIISVEIKT